MDFAESVRKIIRTHGHAVLHVATSPLRYGFSYTLGLADGGRPEMFIVARPTALAQQMLNEATVSLIKHPLEGQGDAREICGHPVRIVEIETARFAAELKAFPMLGRPVPGKMLQVVWACAAGKFPGEDQYSHACGQDMTCLELPRVH